MLANVCSLRNSFPCVIALAFALGSSGTCSAYTFTVGGSGTTVEIGFTDGLGNRLGAPLFSGLLIAGDSVTRSTTNPLVMDHYNIQIKPTTQTAAGDFFFAGTALANVTANTTFLPFLSDEDPTGGLVSTYFVVNVSQWIAGGGVFVPGRVYSGFTNGTNPLLPGFTVGFSTTPIDFTTAFTLNTATGSVAFNQASPFTSSMGSLTAVSSVIAAVPEPVSGFLTITSLAAILYRVRRRAAPNSGSHSA
jgi:hypothetical protein